MWFYIASAYLSAVQSQNRQDKIGSMTPDQLDRFYREEAAQLRRREVEAQEKLADAMRQRARRLWL